MKNKKIPRKKKNATHKYIVAFFTVNSPHWPVIETLDIRKNCRVIRKHQWNKKYIFGGTRDTRFGTHPTGRTQEPRPGTSKERHKTRDS